MVQAQGLADRGGHPGPPGMPDASVAALGEELQRLLTDGGYRPAAKDVAGRLRREYRPEAAVRTIAELVA